MGERNLNYYEDYDVVDLSCAESANVSSLKNVLLVEDDPSSKIVLEKLIGKLFDNVYSFDSVEESLDFLAHSECKIDVLVSDYFLPGKHGSELARIMKKRNKKTKTYIISGSIDEIENELNFHWVDETIPKPVCYDLLVNTLKD